MARWQPHHKVWITLFAVWAFSYADRTITGPVITWMIENRVGFLQDAARPYALGGLLGSLFFAGYMLTQFPGGYFGDRYGHRTIIVISIFWAGVTTILTGLTGGLVAFVAFRVLTGLGEGVLYSNDRTLVAQITPPKDLGFGMGLVVSGLTLGLTGGLLGTVHLVRWAQPAFGLAAWKLPFLLLGGVTLGVGLVAKRYVAPRGERAYPYRAALSALVRYSAVFLVAIMGVYVAANRLGLKDVGIALVLTALALGLLAFISRSKAAEVRPVLRNRNLVLVYVSAIAILWHLWFYGFWSVAVVKELGGGALTSAALVASFNGIAGLVGYPLGGWLSDRVAHRRNGRRNLLAFLAAGLTVLIFVFAAYLMSGHKDLVVMSVILFVSGLFCFAIQPVSHTVTVENAPAELRGSAFGMWNLVAEIGAVLSPVVSGALRDGTGSWTPPLLLDGALMGASCLVILAISSEARAPAGLRVVAANDSDGGGATQTSREIRADAVDARGVAAL